MKIAGMTVGLVASLILCVTGAQAKMTAHYIDVGQAEAILLEFPNAAVMIDAGGECTCDDRDRKHLLDYLTQFFQRRSDLKKTIHTIINSHPHIDHTMLLMDVMRKFKVRNLIDGGHDFGSGIVPLFAARWYASKNQINYYAVKDSDITGQSGFTHPALKSLREVDPTADLKILAANRGCRNANNDSLVILATYGAAKFLFTGDAEALEEEDETCTSEVSHLVQRYKNTSLLNVDVYKVGHHGSFNGTSEELLKVMSPKIAVISAGLFSQQEPGDFHAWQFGHPRETIVKLIEKYTAERRSENATVVTMDKPRQPRPNRVMKKAVYCTCWDGDVLVEANDDGTILTARSAD